MGLSSAIRSVAALLAVLLPFAAPAQEDAEAVYRRFHAAALAANFDEMQKHGAVAGAAQIASLPPEHRDLMLRMVAATLPKSYEITGKEVSPDGSRATLQVAAKSESFAKPQAAFGTITMVKEGGAWKVDEATWGDQKPVAARPAGESAAAKAPAPEAREPQQAPRPPDKGPAKAELSPSAPARPCVIKPVMTDEELAACRPARR